MRMRVLTVVLMLAVASGFLCGAARAAGGADTAPRRWLPVDRNGWTVLRPSADTRVIYVSSSVGDDATGRAYAAGDGAAGPNPFLPRGQVRAFKTLAAGMAQARDGYADWLLLKRGDVWYEPLEGMPNGRSGAEPFLVSACGVGPRPQLRHGEKAFGLRMGFSRGFHDIAIVGLELYASIQDPESPEFAPERKVNGGAGFTIWEGALARHLLIEDCCMRFCGASFSNLDSRVEGIVLRRSLILDNYSRTSHAQGSWATHMSILLEENVYDHNGWLIRERNNRKDRGGATIFNHNTYFCDCHDVVFRGNMFLRPSSMGNKWTANSGPGSTRNIVIDDNLYVEGEIGIGMGGNKTGPLRFRNVAVTNNVFLDVGRAQPTYRNLAWYLDVTDWDGGVVARNLFLHQDVDALTNTHGINLGSSTSKGRYEGEGVHCRNVAILGNVFHGLKTNGYSVILGQGALLQNIVFEGNAFQAPGLDSKLVTADSNLSGVAFRGNAYYSDAEPAEWFRVGGQNVAFKDWSAKVREQGARAGKVDYPAPGRCIETYMASLGMEPTFDAFLAEVRKQSRANWRPEFTAAAVNDWIRAGFGAREAGQ